MSNRCRLCGSNAIPQVLHLGPQPISHHFHADPRRPSLYPLSVGQCAHCQLVQLTEGPDASQLLPEVEWLTYNEPERHLDDLADRLTRLPGLNKDSQVLGVTWKEDTLLARLHSRGFVHGSRLDARADLGIDNPRAGLETVQARFTPEFGGGRDPVDLLLIRHLFEHAFEPAQFLECARRMVKPGGYLVLEVPDCERSLAACDYTVLWEEHVLYFSEATFAGATGAGFHKVEVLNYPLAMENSLVGIWRRDPAAIGPAPPRPDGLFQRFRDQLPLRRQEVQRALAPYQGKKTALLGAGHLATTFLHLMELTDRVDYVLDDNPHKLGLHLPGVAAPICPSSFLKQGEIEFCLLAVNPENEPNLLAKNAEFLAAGGRFHSIFPASTLALTPNTI